MVDRGNACAIRYVNMTTRPSEITIAEMNMECVRSLFDLQQQADKRGDNIVLPFQVDEVDEATDSLTSRNIQRQGYRATETQWRTISNPFAEMSLMADPRMPSRKQLRQLDLH
jgi:hypothetical protein